MKKIRILVVDDEKIAVRNLQHVLKKEGYEVETASGGAQALKLLDLAEDNEFDLVLTDLKMPGIDGMAVLAKTQLMYPETEVIMITGYATVDSAIDALKAGAYHYLAKPFKLDEVRRVVKEALEKQELKRENRQLKEKLAKVHGVSIITDDPQMRDLLRTARHIAQGEVSILITGESGTGKELMARYVHENSLRSSGPFVAVNCGVFTEELLSNELFGHEKGSFTGADRKKIGLIESAGGGTLFLDEITEMSLGMQVKLLRALQEKEIQPLGATMPIKINVRFVAATNRDILKMVQDGSFRQDLYFRINVMNIHLPPLADRRKDIPLLTRHFVDKYSSRMGKIVTDISADAIRQLQDYDFPGNVRELENIVERAVVLTRSETIEFEHLPEMAVHTFRQNKGGLPSLDEQERSYIELVLEQTQGNKTKAAEILGIDRVSLWRKLKKYLLD
ncbi:MAG: sigma-54 dependent transcriptional regulator [Proteobacteria bacterium]|nr:sigma-54 dependent transcriptional regulator [Pseudomonadota bacterium]MBU1714828.1 sigma-54 dependent transcriptional regulator [Pseudomonadota bacterium]